MDIEYDRPLDETISDKKIRVRNLVETFRNNFKQYMDPHYKEAHVRKEFLDKFFKLLDWDVDNDQGLSEKFKEVVNEDAIKIGQSNKAPDYAFRLGGSRIFFAEAKKPSINIKENKSACYQLRRYAWNSKIALSILTDFQTFAVYDCSYFYHML